MMDGTEITRQLNDCQKQCCLLVSISLIEKQTDLPLVVYTVWHKNSFMLFYALNNYYLNLFLHKKKILLLTVFQCIWSSVLWLLYYQK